MKVEYGVARWRDGMRSSIDAKVAHAEFEKIRKANSGNLTPEDVIAKAVPKRSPLHAAFNWDDADAAGEYRKHQARNMINALVCYRKEAPKHPIRMYEVTRIVTATEPARKVYNTIEDICKNPDSRAELFQTVLNELVRCRRKYAQLREFSAVFHAIDELLETQSV
jgi:hypothetical protein